MKVVDQKDLDSFLQGADKTTREIINEDGPRLVALREYHRFFTVELWAAGPKLTPTVGLLMIHGHFYWLAAVRVALSGQMTGVFPLLRTGLEAYCYAAMITLAPELQAIWQDRDASPAAAAACRGAFTGAVSKISKQMESDTEGAGDWIKEHSDATIEWGGHPNPKVVFEHLDVEDRDHDVLMQAIALHTANSAGAHAAIVACLDIGVAMAAVVLWACDLDDKLSERVQNLQAIKEKVAIWRPWNKEAGS